MNGPLSRSEFAVIMGAAADARSHRSGEDDIPMEEAERIAAEVGIDAAGFRAAVQSLRARRRGARRIMGPPAVTESEVTLHRSLTGREALRLLAEGQIAMALSGAALEEIGDTIWRLGEGRRGQILVTTQDQQTRIAVLSDAGRAKVALLTGSTVGGGIFGCFLFSVIAFVSVGTPEALALSNVLGLTGGALLGFAGGRAAWINWAREGQERVHSAIERMRALANGSGGA
jgi:hypothetical protein